MKKYLFVQLLLLLTVGVNAQGTSAQARKILDNTALVVGNKNGAQAVFSMSGKYGNATGTIYVKGNKFCTHTEQGVIWYDGKTQWTLNKRAEEVTVTTPTEAQQQMMNPYKFLSIYKNGFALSSKNVSGKYEIHLTAQNQRRSIKEIFVTIDRQYRPSQIRVRTDKGWTTIKIRNFKTKSLADNTFRFSAKDFPNAEVIDLR